MIMSQLELTKAEPLPATVAMPNVATMLQAVLERGVTEQNVAAVDKLCLLLERMQHAEAEQRFAAAKVEFQRRCPIITATSVIPNRGKYERFEDIMRVIGPILSEVGLSVTFSQSLADNNRVTETCHLSHVGGITKANSFTVRVSGKADTETQGDCKASTTAKRNALCNALNIVIQQDCLDSEHDAAMQGGPITAKQAAELRRRVVETHSNEAKFLKFAQAATYEDIKMAMYAPLDAELKRREDIMRAEQKQ